MQQHFLASWLELRFAAAANFEVAGEADGFALVALFDGEMGEKIGFVAEPSM